jgi:hypothetical protein
MCLPEKESRPVIIEQLRFHAGSRKLHQMLNRKPFVWGQQDDAVQLVFPTMFFQIVPVLENIYVHQQGFPEPVAFQNASLFRSESL